MCRLEMCILKVIHLILLLQMQLLLEMKLEHPRYSNFRMSSCSIKL